MKSLSDIKLINEAIQKEEKSEIDAVLNTISSKWEDALKDGKFKKEFTESLNIFFDEDIRDNATAKEDGDEDGAKWTDIKWEAPEINQHVFNYKNREYIIDGVPNKKGKYQIAMNPFYNEDPDGDYSKDGDKYFDENLFQGTSKHNAMKKALKSVSDLTNASYTDALENIQEILG